MDDPTTLFRELAKAKAHMGRLQKDLLPAVQKGEAGKENPEITSKMAVGLREVMTNISRVGRSIFLALLQKYSFPNETRKKVEAQAKLWGRTKPLRFKDSQSNVFFAFQKVVNTSFDVAKEAMEVGKPLEGSTAKTSAGSFKLVNTGGFKDPIMLGATEALERAEKLLRARGFGKVCYGEVYVTKTLKGGNNLAFYVVPQDALFIRANFRKPTDLVDSILHELAHRLDFKFLKSRESERDKLYRDLSFRVIPKVRPPAVGEIITIRNKTYVVDRLSETKIYLKHPADPKPATAYITLDQYGKAKAREKGESPYGVDGFVSEYAAKSPAENLAEMISAYCQGKLSASLVEALESLIR
jgi:hypothetical protein